jgi:pantetheine-phosphate adenylyltransferase
LTGRSVRRSRLAVLGGTFDRLHAGHLVLLARAFASADQVSIGLVTDAYLRRHPKPGQLRLEPYRRRRSALLAHLRAAFPGRRYTLVPLHDPFGGSVQPGPDLLIISSETRAGAEAVNRKRMKAGLPPLPVVEVPLVRGVDGLPVASRRIRAGDIAPDGTRRRPLRIRLALENGTPGNWLEAQHGLGTAFRGVPFVLLAAASYRPRGIGATRSGPHRALGRAIESGGRWEYSVGAVPASDRKRWWVRAVDRAGPLHLSEEGPAALPQAVRAQFRHRLPSRRVREIAGD